MGNRLGRGGPALGAVLPIVQRLAAQGVGGEGGQVEGPRWRPLSGCIAEAQGSMGVGSVEKDPVVSVGLRRK